MHRALPLHGEPERTRGGSPPPFAAKGFRPFFLLAAAFAAAIVPIWLVVLGGATSAPAYLAAPYWHAHEMVFGFASAVIAGFLLTAVGNWTGRETANGWPLVGLAALWCGGRLAMTWPSALQPGFVATIDAAFLPAVGVVLARPIIATRNVRNLVVVAVVAALAAANVAVHLDALGFAPGWQRRGALVGVDVIVLLVVVIAGRVIPMFTRNATGSKTVRAVPALDRLTILATGAVVVLDVAAPESATHAAACLLAALLAVARSVSWGAWQSRRVPLLWILHVGHAFVPVGLALRALAWIDPAVPATAGVHALTAGAIGALTLGMMARVALGHTGRPLRAPRPAVVGFLLVVLAATARVAGALGPAALYLRALQAAGVAWSAAFALYLVSYGPILVRPRVDGKPG